jgi:hypothetical protein
MAGAALAHHALEALYDTSQEVQGRATLIRVDWINPHAWFRFDLPLSGGGVQKNVLMESLGIGGLRQLGVDKDLLKVGSSYQISYYPSRNPNAGGFVTRLTLPDGRQLGPSVYDPADFCCSDPTDLPEIPEPPTR